MQDNGINSGYGGPGYPGAYGHNNSGGMPPVQGGYPPSYQQQIAPPPGFGHAPMQPVLPPPKPGYYWQLMSYWQEEFGPLPDGSFGPRPVQKFYYDEAPIPRPVFPHHHVYPMALVEGKGDVETEEEKVATATSEKVQKAVTAPVEEEDSFEDIDETGEFKDGGVMVLGNMSDHMHSPLTEKESALISPVISPVSSPLPQPKPPTHSEVLANYQKNFRRRDSLAYPAHQPKYFARTDEINQNNWRVAARHYLPLDIIDRISQLEHIEDQHSQGPSFKIPCQVKSTHRSHKFKFEDGVIELTLDANGRPKHYFLRPAKGGDYLKMHMKGEHLDRYKEVQKASHYPELGTSQKAHDKRHLKFRSAYGIEITIPKKNR